MAVYFMAMYLCGASFGPLLTGMASDRMAKQADAVKVLFQHAVANTNEIATMVEKANSEAASVINKRVSENLDEVKSAFVVAKNAAKDIVKDRETVAKK